MGNAADSADYLLHTPDTGMKEDYCLHLGFYDMKNDGTLRWFHWQQWHKDAYSELLFLS